MAQPAATTTDAASLIEAVRDLKPLIQKHAPDFEQDRQISAPVIEALRDVGVFRMFTPKSLGGLELDLPTIFTIFDEVASIDSAVGWGVPNNSFPGLFGAWLTDAGAADIFGDPTTILAGTLFPPAKAIAVDGGYRITGRTPFVSLCHHATWYIAPAQIYDGDDVRVDDEGNPVPLVVLFPRDQGEIIENWDTLGMRGTGSHDVAATDVFVPDTHSAIFTPLDTPGSAYQGPLYRCPIVVGSLAVAVVTLGSARQALAAALHVATEKTPAYMANPLRDRAAAQAQLAEARAAIEAGRAYITTTVQKTWHHMLSGAPTSDTLKESIQLAANYGTQASAHAIDLIHAVVGTSGIRLAKPFARHFRDVHTLTQHAFASANRYESVGKMMLGHTPDWPFLQY